MARVEHNCVVFSDRQADLNFCILVFLYFFTFVAYTILFLNKFNRNSICGYSYDAVAKVTFIRLSSLKVIRDHVIQWYTIFKLRLSLGLLHSCQGA